MTALSTIGLVARREYLARAVTKAYVISTAITLVAVVGGLVAFAAFRGDGSTEPVAVGVLAGPAGAPVSAALPAAGEALGQPVRVVDLPDEAAARSQVSDGTVEAALVPGPGGAVTVVTESELSSTLAPVVDAAVRQAALAESLQGRGVDPGAVAADVAGARLAVAPLDPPDPATAQRTALAYAAVFLLFFTVFVYGIYVATGVVEEKQSRVVELLLSTITPLQLLVGKVLGIGAVGLTQVVLLGGAGLATATATGVLTLGATAAGLLAVAVLWYVLGFAFFALLYAAAGSLVSRQEDVNAVSGPLTVVGFAAYFAAQYAVNDPGGTVARVLTWVPPFSAYLVPLRTAQGLVSPVQQVGTVALMLLACAVAAALAARVYRRSVLHTGGRQSWRAALARS